MVLNKDKALGALLGVAVGDALGGPVEFMSEKEITQRHGQVREMLGGGWLNLAPGEITDDTQMTLLVAEGIVASPNDAIPSVGELFIKWLDTNPKDVGNTCRSVIAEAKQTKAKTQEDWLAIAEAYDRRTGGQSAGNGALMRTVYPAIFYPPAWAHRPAALIGRMTHWHDHSTREVICYTNAVADLVRAPAKLVGSDDWLRSQVEEHMKIVRERGEKELRGKTPPPSGYVTESALCAMNAIRGTTSFEDAVIAAVNLGGDADTIGAITGGLAGAVYGAEAIPTRWLDTLDKAVVEQIERLVDIAGQRQKLYKDF